MRCAECLTLVEVPFFTRPRTMRRRGAGWAWVAIVAALTVMAVGGTYLLVRARVRADRERTLAALVAAADEDERLGQWDRARDRLDAALALAGRSGLVSPGRRADWEHRRAAIAQRAEQDRRESLIRSAEADLIVARSLADDPTPDAPRVVDLCERSYRTASQVADPRAWRSATRPAT